MTTATVAITHGNWAAAAAANPFAYLVAALDLPPPGLACLLHRLAVPIVDAKRQTFADKILGTIAIPV